MALLSTNRIAWLYTADNGVQYRVNAIKAYTDQNKLGGSAADGTEGTLPHGMKMRRVTLGNSTIGRTRTVPVYSTDADILTPATTINLNSCGLVAAVWTADSYAFENNQSQPVMVIGEKHPRATPTTRQTT